MNHAVRERFDPKKSLLGRELPNNRDAEEGLLASIMLDDSGSVLNRLTDDGFLEEYFYYAQNQKIYAELLRMDAQGIPNDLIVMCDRMEASGELTDIGGIEELSRIMDRVETCAHASHWADIVKKEYMLRQMLLICHSTIEASTTKQFDSIRSLIESHQEKVMTLELNALEDRRNDIRSVAIELQEEMAASPDEKKYKLLDTGLHALDELITGYGPTRMITVAGRPATGKTSMVLSSILEMALKKKIPSLYFSFEMSKSELVKRLVGMLTNISVERIMGNMLNTTEKAIVDKAFEIVKALPIYIEDDTDLTAEGIARKVRHYKKTRDIKLAAVDYIQLVSASPSTRRGTRESEISHISRMIKKTAMSQEVPIVVLAQLNREVERENRKPKNSDLRDSGAIEQDSDQIIMLHPMGVDDGTPKIKQDIEMIKTKDRHGPSPRTKIATFNKAATRYQNDNSFYVKATEQSFKRPADSDF